MPMPGRRPPRHRSMRRPSPGITVLARSARLRRAGNATPCNTLSSVTIGSWSDGDHHFELDVTATIKVTVPGTVPACTMQQAGPVRRLARTLRRIGRHDGAEHRLPQRQAIDRCRHGDHRRWQAADPRQPSGATGTYATIQGAIDAALPGDMIMVDPGVYNELVIMWKPVRLQGVGAASSVINANTQPAGKLNPWRARVSCLFGLALNGQPLNENGDHLDSPTMARPRSSTMRSTRCDPGAQFCPGKVERQ